MRLLHTADWHTGRTLHGIDRTPEIQEALEKMLQMAEEYEAEAILVAGDLYDTKNPSADALWTVNRFMVEADRMGKPVYVIAGNHDNAAALDAMAEVYEYANVRTVGLPRTRGSGGLVEEHVGHDAHGGGFLRVAMLPFVSERRLMRSAHLFDLAPDERLASYQDAMHRLIDNLTQRFRPDMPNVLMMHGTMDGAVMGGSEFMFHSSEHYALEHWFLPHNCYIALGHIHKSQNVVSTDDTLGLYCGSPIQLDFGEAGQTKDVVVVDVFPDKRPELVDTPILDAGKSLRVLRCGEHEIEQMLASTLEPDAWFRLDIDAEGARPGLAERLKEAHPELLVVNVLGPEAQRAEREHIDIQEVGTLSAYAAYAEEQHGREMGQALASEFNDLLHKITEEA